MSDEDNLTGIVVEDIDEEILSKMPDWFRMLREAIKTKRDRDAYL